MSLRQALFFILIVSFFTQCDNKDSKKDRTFLSIFKKRKDREYLDSIQVKQFLTRHKQFESHRNKILKFYNRRNFEVAWSQGGEFLPQAEMMVNMVQDIQYHGLEPNTDSTLRMKYRQISDLKRSQRKEASDLRKELDLLLTASYFEYAREIWKGKVDPDEENLGWHITRKKIKYGKTLDDILSMDEEKATNAFKNFEPMHPEYNLLKATLEKHVKVKNMGGWPSIPWNAKQILKKGDTAAVVSIIKKRLALSGDYDDKNNDPLFSPKLELAVKKFQYRHGLITNGIIDDKTIITMNIPIEERIKQLTINMERWRWVPSKLSPNYLWINIPEFVLYVYEKDMPIWTMNVIVGKEASSTPIFNDQIEYVVFSPSWNIPSTIAKDEIIPAIQKDSTFVSRMKLQVYEKGKPVNASTIKWNELKSDQYSYYSFKQEPGAVNPLGKVKFLLPNEFDVYLHDTPSDHLFSKPERDFSHGCIRLEDPYKMAQYLLRHDPTWDKVKITQAMNSGKEQYVKLKENVPVYIVYFTAWIDKNGFINFREDLYGHDKKLEQKFFEAM